MVVQSEPVNGKKDGNGQTSKSVGISNNKPKGKANHGRSKSRGRSRGPHRPPINMNVQPTIPATNSVKRWADLFSAPSKQANALTYVPPTTIDGQTCGIITEEGVKEATTRWENVLMGYVIGARPQVAGLANYVRWLWKLKGHVEVQHRGNGFFLFRFSSTDELSKVLEGGPWFICARPLVLSKWTVDSSFEQQRLQSIPLWIRLPMLPLRFWSKQSMAVIGSLIGTPLLIDAPTARGSRLEYARLCVEVNVDSNFPDHVWVFNSTTELLEKVAVEYEWKPSPCKQCQTFGHMEEACVAKMLLKGKSKAQATKDQDKVWKVVNGAQNRPIVIQEPNPQDQQTEDEGVDLTTDCEDGNLDDEQVVNGDTPVPPSIQNENQFKVLGDEEVGQPSVSGDQEQSQSTNFLEGFSHEEDGQGQYELENEKEVEIMGGKDDTPQATPANFDVHSDDIGEVAVTISPSKIFGDPLAKEKRQHVEARRLQLGPRDKKKEKEKRKMKNLAKEGERPSQNAKLSQ